jgi:hypothetical protein
MVAKMGNVFSVAFIVQKETALVPLEKHNFYSFILQTLLRSGRLQLSLETQSVLLSPLRKSFQLGITYAAL